MAQCVNLMNSFGNHYKIKYEESYVAERGEQGRVEDAWLLTIPCKHGEIYPHGGQLLGASTNNRGPIANHLAALSVVRIVQDGDDGVNAVFDVDDFDQVAAVMRPKRRRKLSDEQRAERVERLRDYQFSSASHDAGKNRRRDAVAVTDYQAV